MKRLLLLNHFAAPRGAPGGTRHLELAERLTGWQITIVAANRNYFTRDTVNDRSAHYRTVWTAPYAGNGVMRILNWVTYAGGAIAVGLCGPRPDVVYGSSPHLLAGLAGWIVARLRRARFVLEIRDLWPRVLVDMDQVRADSLIYRMLRVLETFLYRNADAIVVMADGVRRVLEDEEGIPTERIVDIPNGADPVAFDRPAARDELRREFGLSGFVVAYTGAHGPPNGLDLVLDAAAKIAHDLPEVCFLLVGDGAVKSALVASARERGLDNVVFREAIAKDRMPALLGAVDVGLHVLADILLFRYGVSPNKLFDYMAAGLPVITNTPGEVAAIVGEAGAGIACPPGGIADAVREIIAVDASKRAEWGANGRAYMARTRSRTALGVRLQNLLDGLTS
ncbi:glycosyltransferase family 4 protein [Frankia sp. CiP3]|uniref:glycosyltransferase family 4 protein n=1 Tax=Frankia sp. CiP3 TaxID=2880971 RepID=UPI001EF5C734|nr:glycosyltransferase family 4 protein [Frankia sp. CiP3]